MEVGVVEGLLLGQSMSLYAVLVMMAVASAEGESVLEDYGNISLAETPIRGSILLDR